jgi:hypothetical protein
MPAKTLSIGRNLHTISSTVQFLTKMRGSVTGRKCVHSRELEFGGNEGRKLVSRWSLSGGHLTSRMDDKSKSIPLARRRNVGAARTWHTSGIGVYIQTNASWKDGARGGYREKDVLEL